MLFAFFFSFMIEVMDEPNQWNSSESLHPEPDDHQDELAYMYQQDEHAGMQQVFQDPDALRHTLAMPGFQRFGSASALPNLSFGGAAAAVKNEQGQPSLSRSSILSFGARPAAATTLSFSGGEDWPDVPVEGVPPERRSRSHLSTLEHVAAERKRREKMQQQFVALATMVPDLTKTDKISILGSTIQYVKQLEKKVKTLENQSARITASDSTGGSTDSQQAPGPSGSTHGVGSSIPTVEASIHDDTVLLKICCERRSGVLVMIISELESLGLSIMNTSVFPFSNSYFSITITAKARIPYYIFPRPH
ncbi:transcription factor bHLH18-like [Panicum virgatum]|uniref:transcription factor bHLH18-like n=1 Tax=Panicum virgatum TaxID=38727 RepID=UPI0019D520F8|nr:transcription factor bHLH18-like [Panicum virgatum]